MTNYVELNGMELNKFTNYMGELYHTQPQDKLQNFIAKYKRTNGGKCLMFPGHNEFVWHHNEDMFKIKFIEEGNVKSGPDGLEYFQRLFIYHDDIKKIQEFLNNVFRYITEIDEQGKVKFYVSKCSSYGSTWEQFNTVDVQTLDNIFIDNKLKKSIVTYLDNFMVSKEKYSKFGRNHKTNLLMSGIPGSGKTSLCKALAKKYGYSIYIMNFTKTMTDSYLIDLTSDVKDNSIILYEDIDSYFTERTGHDVNISFSCLINILDGTLSKGSGIINIITTNFPDKLDAALLRPGRIDKIIHFDYPKKEEIKKAFHALIGPDADFEKFYANIKNHQLCMASVIDYLFRNEEDYMSNIDELISQTKFIQQFTKEESCSKLYS
jgi:hypothetical protein